MLRIEELRRGIERESELLGLLKRGADFEYILRELEQIVKERASILREAYDSCGVDRSCWLVVKGALLGETGILAQLERAQGGERERLMKELEEMIELRKRWVEKLSRTVVPGVKCPELDDTGKWTKDIRGKIENVLKKARGKEQKAKGLLMELALDEWL